MNSLREYEDINTEWHKLVDPIWPEADDLTFTHSAYSITIPVSSYALSPELQHKVNSIFYTNINPLISAFEQTSTFKYRPMLPVGPITAFERQSSVCTLQGSEGTCYAHSGAKVMLQNIYLFVNPITVHDVERFHSCFDVLKTDIEHDYTHLSVEKCGIGYFKILLFLYLYFIFKQIRVRSPDKILMFEEMIYHVVGMPDIEQFKGKISTNFGALRKHIQHKIRTRRLVWDTFTVLCNPDTIPFLKPIIIPILNLGFYVYVGIYSSILKESHAVVLVKHRRDLGQDYFGISNSWGEIIDNTSDLNTIQIKGKTYQTVRFVFVLPFCIRPDIVTTPLPDIPFNDPMQTFSSPKYIRALLEWIPLYEKDIQTFRSQQSAGKKTNKKRKTKKRYC
jgi:hypothetical protein